MATLLESLGQSISSDAIGSIARAAGIDMSQAKKGMEVIGPMVLGSLAKTSQTTSGLDSIMSMLTQTGETGGLLSKVAGMLGGGSPIPAALVAGVLGPGSSTITKALAGRLGFNVAPLLAGAIPAILGTLGTTAKEKKLNSADIAQLLQREGTAAVSGATPEVQALLSEASALGEKAEKLKASFTDAEWKNIRLGPTAVAFYVVSSSPSSTTGISKEVVAAGQAMTAIVKDALPTSLVDVAYGSFDDALEAGSDDPFAGSDPRGAALGVIRNAAAAVKAKSPADGRSFGEALIQLSQKVAESSKEGGFLGIGGTRVSKDEERAIADITDAVA